MKLLPELRFGFGRRVYVKVGLFFGEGIRLDLNWLNYETIFFFIKDISFPDLKTNRNNIMQPYKPPKFKDSSFNCPFCNAYAMQTWGHGGWYPNGNYSVEGLYICQCNHCHNYSIWWAGNMVYPDSSSAPLPNPDLPEEIRRDFEEARSIVNRSPRGAAALFRLCIQKLCTHLGEPGKNINQDIASLVQKGLNPRIQKSLDIVRVVGNDAVHPGEIDLRDDPDTAVQLAQLTNFIADAMITQPKQIDDLYDSLPQGKREQIEKRDGKG